MTHINADQNTIAPYHSPYHHKTDSSQPDSTGVSERLLQALEVEEGEGKNGPKPEDDPGQEGPEAREGRAGRHRRDLPPRPIRAAISPPRRPYRGPDRPEGEFEDGPTR